MRSTLLTLFVGLLTFCAFGDAIEVFLFKDVNYKGLIYTYKEDVPTCHVVADYASGLTGSVKSDTCLMIFDEPGCTGNSFKLSRDLPEVSDLRRPVVSFHPCNATFGGDKIRVDMYDKGNNLIAEYKDVCGCQDLPTQVATKLSWLKNHGNCVTAYSTDTCGGESTDIQAGQNDVSLDLEKLGYYVRSLSGCGTRRACVNLKAKIFKFKILSDNSKRSSVNQIASGSAELSTKTTFYNNGSATVSQVYEAKKVIRESTTMGISGSFQKMETRSSEFGVSMEAEFSMGIPGAEDQDEANGKLSASVGAAIGMGFKNVVELGNGNSTSYTHEEEKVYAVKQTFQIPPCTEYDVFSTVTMVENYPIIYEVYTMITADSSGERLTAEQVKLQVDEMTFVEIHDEYTVIFKTAENIVANMGVETVINGKGRKISNCEEPLGIEAI